MQLDCLFITGCFVCVLAEWFTGTLDETEQSLRKFASCVFFVQM